METIPPTDRAALAFDRWAARCDALPADAARLSGAGRAGAVRFRLPHRASDVLDDVDEALLVFRATRDADRHAAAMALHLRVEACLAAVPPHLRGQPGRARRHALPPGEAPG